MMLRIAFLVYTIFLFSVEFLCVDFKQDGAKVNYCNPKYVKNCSVWTGRKSRRDPYLTNMSATTLMPFGNNVTFALVLQMKSGGDFKVSAKVCDTIKSKWMLEFMNRYSNLTLDHCPFPAVEWTFNLNEIEIRFQNFYNFQAKYLYQNMELPPRNVPLPIADGDYFIKIELYMTATKEIILDAQTTLHFDSRSSVKNNKNNRKNKTRNG